MGRLKRMNWYRTLKINAMIAFKLAFKNLVGAGLRTWLNVSVLSFAFVVIVFYNGMLDGWNQQARHDTIEWETGYGELWHPQYDPYDPYCLLDSHAPISNDIHALVTDKQLTPVLITQASVFPEGRIQNVLLKGIDPEQNIIKIPTSMLVDTNSEIPVVIGKRMAASAKLKEGDKVLLRWRDMHGTFDAREIRVAGIFSANVPSIDNGQIWISLPSLQKMTGMENQATLFIAGKSYQKGNIDSWKYKDLSFLMKDINEVIQTKKASASIIYGLLLVIALLAIFDTQVLSIFRRQKEIGTYIALGMTRGRVVRIFTIEGSAHSILAIIFGSLYGIPLLAYLHNAGIAMPKTTDSYGLAIAERIIPVYSIGMILSSVLLVIISATIVSYFPTRRISKLNPTEALKGKIQ
jgi:putative ABC transport system permease protein